MKYEISDKTGKNKRCTVTSLEYNGEFMGESYVLCKVESEVPIDFQTGDYLEYRGEKYEINYDPSVLKKCRASYNRDAFTYDSIKLNSASNDLVKCLFLDYVKEDDLIHYSSLPKFSFFASNVEDLAERIQANLDRLYSGDRKWTVKVSPGCGGKTDVYVAAEQINVWTALGYSYSKFKVPFIIKGRTITIGAASETLNKVFKYGKNNGLYEIESVTGQDADIITRLRVYGSTRNLPNRYYNNLREAYAIVEISRIEYERIDNTHAKCKIFSDNAPEKIGTWSEVRINGEVHKVASRQEFDGNVPSPKECTFIELSKGKYELLSVPVTYEEHHNGLNYEIKMLWHEAMIGTECEVYVEGMLRSTFEVRNSNNRSLCYDKAYAYVRDILLIPAEEIPGFNSFMSSASYTDHGDGNHEYDLKLYHETSVEYELVGSPSPTRFEILYASETSKVGESFLTGNHNGSLLPNNMYAPNLMLPDFPSITLDPYIDSDNIEKYGIREGCVFFDGSNDELEEISPSIEGMKAEDLRDAGIDVSLAEGDNGNLDELADAEKIQDDGAITPGDIIPTFTVTLKDVGFDLAKEIGDDSSISMKSGYCSGREFKIRNCVPTEKDGAKCYLLRCERAEDESNKLYYPYKSYPLQAGDKFVILGIGLPDVYVKAASQRLLREGKECLSEVDHMKHTYSPKIDEIAMARQHDEAIQSGGISLHDTIKEGMLIRISDEDLFNEELHITIDTLTIKEGESLIPSYEITLKEAKEEGTLERMQNKIDAIASGNSVNHAGGTIVNLQGNYLKKDTEDAATALISFLKGLLYGNYKPGESGGALKEDGSAEFDSATIRKGLNIGEFSSINRIGDAVLNSISLRNLFQIGNFSSGESGGQISDDGAAELASLLLRGALEIGKYSAGKSGAKIGEDGAAELLSVLVRGLVTAKGIQSPGFSTGALGTGLCLKMDENGDSYIEVDRMLVRKVAEFIQLVIQEIKHVGGQIVLTTASMKCIRVEDTGDSYRCYFEATDGEKTVENQFVAGDQARAQTFNVKEGVNENVKNTYYWRLVTGVGDNYIDLSKTDCDAGSTVPAAGDEIVQLGNRNDVARQAAIILSAYGNDAPYFKMYRGINSYKLEGKEFVNLSREDVMIISDNIKLSTGETVKEYINGAVGDVQSKVDEVSGKVEDAVERLAEQQNYIAALQKTAGDLQNQIDGAIESYFEKTDPTTSNYPANEWTTEEQKQAHSKDTYTNISTGKSWRWVKDGSAWKWIVITDTATEKALAAAAKAQDTADGKRRVFVSQPATGQAYDVGDLWVNATYGETYKNDLLRCKTAKKENEAFSISHWELASRYTDDTKANEAAEAAREAAEAANAAQEAADEAAATAGEAKTEAQAANTELDNLKSDGTISPVEKTALKQQHADIKAEHGQITSEAGKYSISVTDYEAAYKKADAALTKYTASTPEYITVESDYSDISAYYSRRQTILDAIAAKAKEASDAAKKAADDAAAKAEEAAESASEAAQKAIEAKTAADNAATAAKNAQDDADEANSMLSDIANDNKLTAQEKQQTKKEWDVIVSEKPKNDASADKFGVSKTAYGSAYTALSTYITPLLSDLSSTSNITGTEFRAKFKAYYDARTDLLNAISAKAKELADNAQEAADAAAENASQAIEDAAAAKNAADKAQADVDAEKERMDEWAADGKFSPSEKKQLKEELARIDGDKTQVTDGYTKYGLGTPTAYNTAYTNYRTAINGVVSSSSETVAIPSDFATKRTAYYTQKSAALTAISDAAKAYADKVVAGIEVGGRNLLENSLDGTGWNKESISNGVFYRKAETQEGFIRSLSNLDIKGGVYYTLSFDYYTKNNGRGVDLFLISLNGTKVMASKHMIGSPTSWTHYVWTFKTTTSHGDRSDCYVRFDNNGTGSGISELWVRYPKLEKGNVATAWTPSIEDVNGMIEDAQKAADDAAEAAKNAQADAANANKELTNIKSDNLISPIEKTALKQQQADIRSEYGEITANAARYAVSTTAYKSAYDLANAALTKYTASSPEYITVGSDYANISAYYDARKTILDAIAAAAKKAADDATNKANQAVEDAARAGHYYLDLDNDSGQVACDADGNVTGGYPTTNAKVWYGTEVDTGWSFKGTFSGCTGSVGASSGAVTVTAVSKDDASVTITATKSGKPELSTVFTIVKVKSGRDGEDGANGTSVTVKSTSVTYAVSTSGTTAPGSGWSGTIPSVPVGQYLWSKTVVTYSDGKSTTTHSCSYQGKNGSDGKDGADGTSVTVTAQSTKYAVNTTGNQPADSAFTATSIPSLSPGQYLWSKTEVTYSNGGTTKTYAVSRIGSDGADGTPGAPGADGKTSYLHIAYANDTTGGGFSVSDSTNKLYIGQYTDFTLEDSTDYRKYSWTRIKGNTGATGATGPKGDDALFYIIEPSANVVKKSWDNKLTPTSVTCKKFKCVGNTQQETTEKTLKYQRVGQDSSVQNYTGAVAITQSTKEIVFYLYDGSTLMGGCTQRVPVIGDAVDVYTKVNADFVMLENEFGVMSEKVTTVVDSVTGLEKEVETNTSKISAIDGKVNSTASQVSSLGTRVSTVEQTASSLTTTVNGLNGKVSKLEQTDSSLTSRITSAEGKVSTIEQKVSSISLKVDGIDPVNLFRDGSFESGYNTFRTSGSGKDDVEVGISANGKVGKNAMMVKWPGKRTLVYIEQDIRVVENSKYTLALWVYANKETSTGHDLVITAYNKNGSSLSISDSTVNLNVPKTSWTRFVHTFTVPTGTEYVNFYIRGTLSVDADTLVYYDGVMLLKGDYLDNIPSYFIPNDSVNGDTLLSTGIDIENKKVIVTSDQFVIKNNDGEVTASVNEDGVLSVGSGEFSGFIRTIPRIITKNTGDNGDVEFKDNYYQISLSNLYKGGFIYVDVESNSYAGDGIKLPLGLKYAGARVTIVNKYPAKRLIITTRHEALDPGYGDWSDDENNAMRLGGVQISHVEMGNVSTQGNNRFVELLAVPYYLDETIGSVKYQGQVEWVVLNNQEFTTANNTTGGKYAKFK